MTELNLEQTQAFLDSLWPNGDQAVLHNPTRTYFSALIGNLVPTKACRMKYSMELTSNQLKLAKILRSLAENLEHKYD